MSFPSWAQHYDPKFVTPADRDELLGWLTGIRPLWEMRYGERHPPPPGQSQRPLLRPVYWLGSWQFACLDYYRPPNGTKDRCVAAEPFPPVMQRWCQKIEKIAARKYVGPDRPAKWRLNVCLVNFYGSRVDGDKREDAARVGEHRDFEPGPVASVSIGERAMFQFVTGGRDGGVAGQQWLDDGSLQIFGGPLKKLFHRVQRVDKKLGVRLPPDIDGFETRRVNLTFRYVPDEHVVPFAKLGADARHDVRGYVSSLAESSPFWASALAAAS
jgi:alkylated DNA repair protein (DNA oxidative demethylase)